MSQPPPARNSCWRRRTILGVTLAELVTPTGWTADQGLSRPQADDLLVFENGARAGATIDPAELALDAPPVRAWAMEPANHVVRNQSRYSQLLLVRLNPTHLTAHQAPFAADGIVAFSAICTHAGCAVSGWKPAERHFYCPCHASVYDPADDGRVVAGPAPRPLPALPLRISDGALTVAAGFTDRIGGSTGRTD